MLIALVRSLLKTRVPGQLIVQVTDKCNARCPQCGMRATEKFSRTTLTVEAIKTMLDAAPRHRVQAVSFTGGEPLLFLEEILELARHAGRVGIPFVRTGTNGFIFRHWESADFGDRMHRLAERLAATPVRNFWISIDSADAALHEEMRGFPGVVRGIEKALPIFHAHGIYPSANLGINRNMGGFLTRDLRPGDFAHRTAYLHAMAEVYRKAFRRFYGHIIDLGFTMVNTCYPMSIGDGEAQQGLHPVYAATAIGDVVRFSADEKAVLFRALLDTIPRFRSRIRIFSPLCALYALTRHYKKAAAGRAYPVENSGGYGCRGGLDFWFVDAKDGHTYPCGYRGGEDLGPFEKMPAATAKTAADCNLCDWECFRDPSELFGPLLEGLGSPMRLLKHFVRDPQFFRYWGQDIVYYRACNFFDGRQTLRPDRLRRFLPHRDTSIVRSPVAYSLIKN